MSSRRWPRLLLPAATYLNPVVAGDHLDPSVIRVGGYQRHGSVVGCIATGVAVPALLAGAFFTWTRGTPVNFGGVLQRMSISTGWVWIALLALRMKDEAARYVAVSTGAPSRDER